MKVYGSKPRQIESLDPRVVKAIGPDCKHTYETDAADAKVYWMLETECPGVEHELRLEGSEIEPIPDVPGLKE